MEILINIKNQLVFQKGGLITNEILAIFEEIFPL
jgi:hypothetical protein